MNRAQIHSNIERFVELEAKKWIQDAYARCETLEDLQRERWEFGKKDHNSTGTDEMLNALIYYRISDKVKKIEKDVRKAILKERLPHLGTD